MTKRKAMYLIMILLIILTVLLCFMFLFPKDHVYSGVLAKGKNMLCHLTHG